MDRVLECYGQRVIHLTFDQDWAPAWATRAVLEIVAQAGLEATFFVTHACPANAELRQSGAFELGWHPNFLPGSSHGSTIEEVLDTLAELVPDAQGARAHCLVQGTPYLQAYRGRGLRYDASDLHDDQAGLGAHSCWTGMIRFPIFFEDDVHLARSLVCTTDALGLERPGLRVLNFHPVLVALNARDLSSYAGLKADLALRGVPLTAASERDFMSHRQENGVGDLLGAIVQWLAERPELAGGTLASALSSGH